MEVAIFINTLFAEWIHICTVFGVFSFIVGIVYFSIAFLMKSLIKLEVKIREEKVLREALKLYKKHIENEDKQ